MRLAKDSLPATRRTSHNSRQPQDLYAMPKNNPICPVPSFPTAQFSTVQFRNPPSFFNHEKPVFDRQVFSQEKTSRYCRSLADTE